MSLFRRTLAATLAASLVLSPVALAQDLDPTPAAEADADAAPAPEVTPEATPAVEPTPVAVERSGSDDEDVTVRGTSDRTVWAGGRSVDLSAKAPDAIAAGETVTLHGEVTDNFIGAGRLVTIKGPVGGDAILFGETLTLDSDVAGDVYAMGETLVIPADVTVGGNLYFGGAKLSLAGAVDGDLLGGGADIDVSGTVGGDVKVDAADLHIGPTASIGGNVDYESPDKGDISGEAAIAGDVDWSKKIVDHDDEAGNPIVSAVVSTVFWLLGALLVGAVLLGLFPRAVTEPAAILREDGATSLGVGFAVLLGVPVLAVFLALFILPIPLSLLALAIWVPSLFLARFIAALVVGELLMERFGSADAGRMQTLLVGVAAVQLAAAVPYLGGLAVLAATVLGLGALFLAARRAGSAASAT